MNIIGKRIGIVGGGQLGKMMILEAKRLGFYVCVLDPVPDCPSHSICDEHIIASLSENTGYFELAKKCDVITYEWENINADALETLEREGHLIYPSVKSLKTIQNKFLQKTKLQEDNIPLPRFSKNYNNEFGFPVMFKASCGGYDGKGNWVLNSINEVPGGVDGFFEELVNFEMEISVIACRGINGVNRIYPVGENIHKNNILDTTIVPARINNELIDKAARISVDVMRVFEGVGTFCVELFVTKNGEVLVNEVAPRPHNSGHYTIEGCFCNQYENHIRAITGLPLGNTELIQPTVMVNLLGTSDGKAKLEGIDEAYKDSMVQVHFYGKSESKTGRKMGHYTVVGDDALERAEKLKSIIKVTGG